LRRLKWPNLTLGKLPLGTVRKLPWENALEKIPNTNDETTIPNTHAKIVFLWKICV